MTKNHLTHPQLFPSAKWIVLGLAFFSFFMSALISRTVFERLPHLEDEVAYLFQARTLERGDLVIPSPDERRAFWQPFVVDVDGTRFGKYTIGYPLQLSIGERMGQGWVINAFAAMLSVALVYRLGREIFDEDTGVIAAALTAFSPAALLLNASLMGHTTALFASLLFIYAYWRIEKRKNLVQWGIVAGIALGMLVINRPLTGIAIVAPFIVRSLALLLRDLLEKRNLLGLLRPFIALSVFAGVIALAVPIYNNAAVGDPTDNLYKYVWSYDTIGFGECCGRSGHTLEKAIRHMRFDLSLAAADLFGWGIGEFTPEVEAHLESESNYYPIFGLSFFLLPFGIIVAFRQKSLSVLAWALTLMIWFFLPYRVADSGILTDPTFAWLWVIVALAWLMLPIFLWRDTRQAWAWMLIAIVGAVVLTQMTYWIGSQRYSTRYYYEALPAMALLSALPLAWLAQRINRRVVYGIVAVALLWSLYAYSTPRITTLYRFNNIHHDLINGIEARRNGDQPVLAIINGDDVRWRAFGSLMAVTSPYLDSDIVAAHSTNAAVRLQVLRMFPNRQVIELNADGNDAWFLDEEPP